MLKFINTDAKCITGYDEMENEEQALGVFSKLAEFYYEAKNQKIMIKNSIGWDVDNVKDFLRISVGKKPKVKLEGNGWVGGIYVNGMKTFDFYEVSGHTKDWDKKRDGTCHSCRKYTDGDTKTKHVCEVNGTPTWSKDCRDYDPKLKNAEGGPARTLEELIEEAVRPYLMIV